VADVVPVLIDYERRARDFLVRETEQNIHDQVSRAYGILRTAQTITAEETMQLLSRVRMGVLLGLLDDVNVSDVNLLLVRTQPAHLQKLRGIELDTKDRNIERARFLRKYFETGSTEAN
jgi:protein arginine kinase